MNAPNSFFSNKVENSCKSSRVRVATAQGLRFLDIEDIASILSNAPYCYLHLTDGTKMFCTQPIRHFDEQLSGFGFVRVHKSHLVNVTAVEVYQPEGNGSVKLVNGQRLLFARGKKRQFSEVLDEFCL